MRILLVHNRYQKQGGEDRVLAGDAALLRARGHDVEIFEENNDSIVGWTGAARATFESVYSFSTAGRVEKALKTFEPDLVHVHNFFPRISPSVHYTCHRHGVPVVQTLHNYRLLCPGAMLMRDGKICEDCIGKSVPWPAVAHKCYRGSAAATAAVANMLTVHGALGTWTRAVSRFITPTEFARQKFIEGGFPADRIAVKPNFVTHDCGMGSGAGGYALFVGRLSPEKGIDTLLAAWQRLGGNIPLKIVGDGPLAPVVEKAAATMPGVEWLGARTPEQVARLMGMASFLVCPSIWYETFGLVLAEAFSAGLPVFASRLGALAELVTDGETGRLFTPGSADQLVSLVDWALAHPSELSAMRLRARRAYEMKYTPDASYTQLMEIYRSTLPHTAPAARTSHAMKRLAILVNIIAPYRVPILASLAGRFNTLVLHGGSEPNRTWTVEIPETLETQKVFTIKIPLRKRIGIDGVTDVSYLHLNLGLLPWLLRFRPQIVVSSEMGVRTITALLYGSLARVPVWVWWGGTMHSERNVSKFKAGIRKLFARVVRHWLSYGESTTEYLLSIGVPRHRIQQIQNCVPHEVFQETPQRAFRFRKAGGGPVILSVGQLIQRKGLDKLIEACGRQVAMGRELTLVLVGQGPERQQLADLARAHGVRNFEIIPNQPQTTLNAIYRAADAFVFPTLEDVWGLVVNEALWAGTPVLCSQYAGCAHELMPPSNIFDPMSPLSFDKALNRVFDGTLAAPDLSRLMTWQQVAAVMRTSLETGKPVDVRSLLAT